MHECRRRSGPASRRLLGVRTASGRNVEVRLRGPAYAQLEGLTTGTSVEVLGAWMHAEVTPGSPRPASDYFAAAGLKVTGSAPQPPAGDGGGSAGGGGAVVAAAAARKRPVLSFNQLVSKDVRAIFIPSESAC